MSYTVRNRDRPSRQSIGIGNGDSFTTTPSQPNNININNNNGNNGIGVPSIPTLFQNRPMQAYVPPQGSYRPNYSQSTPTRTNSSNAPLLYGSNRQPVPNAVTARPPPRQVYRHPSSYAPGPLPYFLPPPGQPTTDPSLATPPTTQACYTTYPSRLRTGVTGLIQPEHITGGPRERELFLAEYEREIRGGSGTSTPRVDSPAPFGGSARRPPAVTNLSGRRGRVVNYAEKASDDEDEDEDEDEDSELSELEDPPSDPEDKSYGPSGGRTGRPVGRPRKDRDNSLVVGGQDHQAAMRAGKLKRKRDEMDRGWTWLGDRTPGDRVSSQPTKGTRHAYNSEELLEEAADRPELLVPITVDLDVPSNNPDLQGIKIKDRFLWNLNEPFFDPLRFSEVFCEDVGIPAHPHASTIAELIKAQLEEAQNAVEIDITNEEITEDDVVWSDEEVERVMEVDAAESPDEQDAEEVLEKAERWDEADCRIIVNLDVQIYTHILRDRIEWDLSSSLPPAIFAKQYCSELGLTGEAIPLIAHAITEELIKHKRDALELELFASTHPEEQAKWERTHGGLPKVNRKSGAKGLVGVWRDWWEREEFGPVLIELTMEEMERRELERTREARRIMRTLTTSKRRR